jgi:transposase
LTGIVFVLKTGISWDDLPDEMGCGCGMTCFRRLRDWHQSGIWQRIRPILENRLQYSDQVDWERANLDLRPKRKVRRPSPDNRQTDTVAELLQEQVESAAESHLGP